MFSQAYEGASKCCARLARAWLSVIVGAETVLREADGSVESGKEVRVCRLGDREYLESDDGNDDQWRGANKRRSH